MLDSDPNFPAPAVPAAVVLPVDTSAGEMCLTYGGVLEETGAAGPPPPLLPPEALRGPPGVAESLLLSLLFNVVIAAVSLISFVLRLRLDGFSQFLLQLVIVWPLVLWVGLRRSGVSFREAIPQARFPARIVPALLLASHGATIVLIHLASSIDVPTMLRQTLTQGIPSGYWMSCFLSAVVVAPVAEELFFRGLVLRGFVARYSAFHAVWMSALLFALFHLNLWQGILALPLGLAYAWLVLRTGSVIPGIISHAAVNFSTNFLMVPLMQAFGYDAAARQALGGRYPLEMVILGAVLAAVGGFLVWRQLAARPAEEMSPDSGSPFS